MRVVLVNFSLDAARGGGTAERTRHLALHLARHGCECHTMAISGRSWNAEFQAAGIRCTTTGSIGRRLPVPLLRPLRAWRAVRRADVVHIMGYWNLLSVVMGALARAAGTPYVLCPAGEFTAVGTLRNLKHWFHRLFGKRLMRGASAYIAITALEAEAIQRVTGRAPEDVWVVPNAVQIPATADVDGALGEAAPSAVPGLPSEPYLLFMGRLAPVKGPDLLLQAYLASPVAQTVPLVMAGPDFGMQADLQRLLAPSAAAGKVSFPGYVGERERAAVYRNALMLVIPSRSEAMSLVALEAGAQGVPVLLTDTCGFDAVQAVGGGLVVPAEVQGLRQGLERMLAQPAQLPAMGAALRALVAERYSWPAVSQQLIGHFKTLVRARGRH